MQQCINRIAPLDKNRSGVGNEYELGALIRNRTEVHMRRFIKLEMENRETRPNPEMLEKGFDGLRCEIITGGRTVSLKGRFDRIDNVIGEISHDFHIIDYKKRLSPWRKLTKGLLRKKEHLQLPIYLLAAQQILGVPLDHLRASLFSIENAERHSIDPADKKFRDFFSSDASIAESDSEEQVTLSAILLEVLASVTNAHFDVRGNLRERENVVGRWLELPPELTGSD
jgi:DNA-binding transcriptional regulator/RsmH inhibitor MraZ